MSKIKLLDIEVSADLNVFILEDTPLYQKKMVSTLMEIGFNGKFNIAPSLKVAAELSRTEKIDLFLLDWNLPDGTGLDFLKTLKVMPQFEKTPVLMVTTMDDISNILSAVGEGVDGYIVKPYENEEVIEKLSFAFEKKTIPPLP